MTSRIWHREYYVVLEFFCILLCWWSHEFICVKVHRLYSTPKSISLHDDLEEKKKKQSFSILRSFLLYSVGKIELDSKLKK